MPRPPEQDASRARSALEAFAKERGLRIAGRYIENESGAKLHRPELFRLLADCEPGDVLLVEQADRLSRLPAPDWQKLRAEIDAKQVRIVALELPISWTLAAPPPHLRGDLAQAPSAARATDAPARSGASSCRRCRGGEAGARLLLHLGMTTSPDTVLRLVRGLPLPAQGTPHVIGIDEWAFRKGRTYGTLVVDLERWRPLDLLPDRSGATVTA